MKRMDHKLTRWDITIKQRDCLLQAKSTLSHDLPYVAKYLLRFRFARPSSNSQVSLKVQAN